MKARTGHTLRGGCAGPETWGLGLGEPFGSSLDHSMVTEPMQVNNPRVLTEIIGPALTSCHLRPSFVPSHLRAPLASSLVAAAVLQLWPSPAPSHRPMIELCIPSSLDPTLAPPGCHVISIFTQYTPYTLAGGKVWDEQARNTYADKGRRAGRACFQSDHWPCGLTGPLSSWLPHSGLTPSGSVPSEEKCRGN